MRNNGTRYNADLYRALDIIKQYNVPNQPKAVDEAPYGLINRAKDAVKGGVGAMVGKGQMSKGRIEAGRLSDDLNKQYLQFLGQRGHKNQKTQTIQDLTDFFTKFSVDPSAYFAKAGVAAGEPTTVLTKKQSDNVVLQIGQGMASSGKVPPGMGGAEDPAAATAATGTAPAPAPTAGGAAAGTATSAGSAGAAFGRKSDGTATATGGTATAPAGGTATATATGGAGGAGGTAAPGAAGADGTPGAPGAAGADGTPGEPGAAGEPGAPGAAGADGTPGADAPAGEPGAAGEPGEPGADGAAGEPGAAGADGTPGEPGEPGATGEPEPEEGEPEEPAAPAQKFNNGDEISYITSKGKAQDGIFVQYLDNTDAQGDPQAQVRQPNQTDAQAYAIDADSIGPIGSPPVNNDAAKASTPAQNEVLAQVEKLNDNDRVKLKNAIGKILTSQAAKASTTGAAA